MQIVEGNGRLSSNEPKRKTSGAKALTYFAAFTARLKSHPIDEDLSTGTPVKSCPDTNLCLLLVVLIAAPVLFAQSAPAPQASATESAPIAPIAIVPLDNRNPDAAAKVTGALEVSQGKAVIGASGTVTSGNQTTEVVLPHRGVLRVCASTTVKLAAGASVTAGETPGLMMALDHGAVEMSFATSRNSDILLTPDFRISHGFARRGGGQGPPRPERRHLRG